MATSTMGQEDLQPEKEVPAVTSDPEAGHDAHLTGKAWMYKPMKIGPWSLPYFASPESQLLLVSFVCFLCPGMYNAVSGLGGGGQLDPTDVSDANTALYSTFAVVGFFAGSIANRIGLRLTLSFGGFGYFLYVASLLSYNHNKNSGFLIFAGALLGVCGGLLWCAQGAVMMSYPNEKEKGKFIAIFWVIFNLGGVIGSLVPLGQNLHSEAGQVNDGTYIAFMVLMAVGFVLAWGLSDSKYVKRKDGSHVIVMKNPTWKSEFLGLYDTIRSDYYIILFFPMFLVSNWFTAYQFNSVNGAYFNIRTRSLNNLLYWLMQMVGAFVFGQILDLKFLSRPMRAKLGLFLLFVITMGVWGGGYAFQKTYTRKTVSATTDWTTSGYAGPMFLYMFYGFYDAAFQTCAYWFMGSLTNNARKLANFAGFYKGIQSAGAAGMWRMDAVGTPYMTEFASCWGLLAGSLLIASPVVFFKIKEHADVEADLNFSDETAQEVGVPLEDHPSEKKDEKVVAVA
ncbi:MFS general substrate transporter [Aspergillus sclerotioniger CBS 115572]|uniref:MFS general substrate transporter n=1 Tax=Aspergillus sclerotioniger CBS 115572 TaxID=1450535 RepID=A0A317VGI3_9EURO|nr:MFS general substrate transporter [Aspergillus sclerotioniger CBS 115572]PWY72529.1 MFS general substrate transporter [Aspergillus sclerotioniger CBS 115572]